MVRRKTHPRLSRDELVAIIGGFYKFLVRFYLPSAVLKQPPPEGWPNITPETTKGFGKSPIVLDLLKHLPYIDETRAHEMMTNIHYKCDVVDYSTRTQADFEPDGKCYDDDRFNDDLHRELQDDDEEEDWPKESEEAGKGGSDNEEGKRSQERDNQRIDEEQVEWEGDRVDEDDGSSQKSPEEDEDQDWEYEDLSDWDYDGETTQIADLVTLAKGYESGGHQIVLDVFNGVIHEEIVRFDVMPPVCVEYYFQGLQQKYESLELVPIPGEQFEDFSKIGEDEVLKNPTELDKDASMKLWREANARWFKKIYWDYGWPGEGYRREEALAEIRRWAEEYHRLN